MKNTRILTSLAILPLAFASACSIAPAQQSAEAPSSTAAETTAAPSPSAEASTQASSTPSESSTLEAVAESSESQTSVASASAVTASASAESSEEAESVSDANVNARGNYELNVGDSAILRAKDGTEIYNITLKDIQPEFECTDDPNATSENGQLVALNLDVTASSVDVMKKHYHNSTISISDNSWDFIASDGTVFNGQINQASIFCIDSAAELPGELRAGEKGSGAIILDLPSTDGSLVFEDRTADVRWEWKLSQ